MKESMLEKLRTLLDHNDIPTAYLSKNIERGMKYKSMYLDLLGMNEANDWRIVLDAPQNIHDLPYAEYFVDSIRRYVEMDTPDVRFKLIDYQYIMIDKNKLRTTKLITKYWDKLRERYSFRDLMSNINLKLMDNGQDIFSTDEITLERFLILWGDYTKNGLVAVLSANPWDYLILSDDSGKYCSYSSCVRYNNGGGEYFNTCLHYLISPSVFIGYTADKANLDKKIGRTIVYIGGTNTVCTSRVYGSMSDGNLLALRDYCQAKLSVDDPYRWTSKAGTINEHRAVSYEGGAYIDTGYGVVTVKTGEGVTACDVIEGCCLDCGSRLAGADTRGRCRECNDSYRCHSCGEQ